MFDAKGIDFATWKKTPPMISAWVRARPGLCRGRRRGRPVVEA